MTFLRYDAETLTVHEAERVAGPGFSLDASKPADRQAGAAHGWPWFDSRDEWLATPDGKAYQAALLRQTLLDAGVATLDDLAAPGDGETWAAPVSVLGAYRLGATVTHAGKTWESLVDCNVWEPGSSGWREIAGAGSGPAAWVQPTGAHDAYGIGDVVTHLGQTWVSTHANNVWPPGVFGWVPNP